MAVAKAVKVIKLPKKRVYNTGKKYNLFAPLKPVKKNPNLSAYEAELRKGSNARLGSNWR